MSTHAPRPRVRALTDVRLRLRRDDRGVALVMVIGSMMVLAMFVMAALAYAVSSTKFSRYDRDYSAAMTAAQSGVEDLISRLNRDDNYGRSADCTNPALMTPSTCGAYGWLPVTPGETDPDAPAFRYDVDTSRAYTEGTIMVNATGRANGVYRTVEVAVGKGGSTDFVYYTDFESADPENRVAYPSGAPNRSCGRDGAGLASYHWQGRSGCREIQFGGADVLDGRVFSNDAILSVGGRFLQGVESAFTNCRNVEAGNRSTWNRCLRSGSDYMASGSNATFDRAPQYHEPLYLADSSALFADLPGCHYYGATRIIFDAGGTMRVWSKNSDFSGAVLAIPDDAGNTPNCGSGTALSSAAGASVPVPTGMVIYVDGAPTSGPGSVVRRQLHAGEIGGESGRQLPLGTYDASVPETPTTDGLVYTVDNAMRNPTKYAGEGNLYVQGVVKGQVTLASRQSIIVTGDLVLAGGVNGADLVGLVATNSVEVMHPWMLTISSERTRSSCTRNCAYRWVEPDLRSGTDSTSPAWPQRVNDPSIGARNPTTGLQIAASIQTLQHSLFVQQYEQGRSRAGNGALYVHGSIAQRWRGAVGTAGSPGTGYDKDYRYDVRLRYTAPPYFPHWVNAQWSIRYSGEVVTPDELR